MLREVQRDAEPEIPDATDGDEIRIAVAALATS
jgi:hypothetical protein